MQTFFWAPEGQVTTKQKLFCFCKICVFLVVFQGSKADDDDFQDFQEAPKAGSGDDSFTDFQGETMGTFPSASSSQSR